MARRNYQAGSVFQKGKTKREAWDTTAPAYGRYWKDVPGAERRRVVMPLGICRTRTIAERKCAEEIEKLGINSTQTFVEATNSTTFKLQAELWLRSLANRKRDPLEQTTIDARRYYLDKWILPRIGGMYLANITNLTMKTLVDEMAGAALSAASIRDYTNIAKAVIASAVTEDGEEKFPRKWKAEIIDAPRVVRSQQRQPTTECASLSDVLLFASGQFRVLYALLAGCGPLRAGEALGLEIDKHISEDFRTLHVVQQAKRGEISDHLKTENGKRDVDLCTSLAAVLREFVGERKSGLLFSTSTGNQLLQTNVLKRSLHPILDYIAHERGGFNIFRRFRITHLATSDCPDFLKHFWSGHEQTHISERYTKLTENRDFRLKWAERIGLGFELPGAKVGQLGQLLQFRKAV